MIALRTLFGLRKALIRASFIGVRTSYCMATLKQQTKSIKIKKPASKADIVSLLSDELEQLSKLDHYATSVSHLQRNQIPKSYAHLEYALTESKAKFPESVNLQMFLLNRMSILQKILNQEQKFLGSLQEIFFMCLSLKGEKSLDTLKHLHNYMTALVVREPGKLGALFQWMTDSGLTFLAKKSRYFKGISEFYEGNKQKALKDIEASFVQDQKKYLKINNINWFKLLLISNDSLEAVPLQKQPQLESILKQLILALVEAQKAGDLSAPSAEIEQNLKMTQMLTKYIQNPKSVVLLKLNSKTVLLNNQSHIILMNIAHNLYLQKKPEQASLFMRIALQSSIQLQEPYRLGLGLILLSKINQRLKLQWEPILLDILKNRKVYTSAVLRECLLVYSRMLFVQGRYYEAEGYVVQAGGVRGNLYVQGLVLPDFDFSF